MWSVLSSPSYSGPSLPSHAALVVVYAGLVIKLTAVEAPYAGLGVMLMFALRLRITLIASYSGSLGTSIAEFCDVSGLYCITALFCDLL